MPRQKKDKQKQKQRQKQRQSQNVRVVVNLPEKKAPQRRRRAPRKKPELETLIEPQLSRPLPPVVYMPPPQVTHYENPPIEDIRFRTLGAIPKTLNFVDPVRREEPSVFRASGDTSQTSPEQPILGEQPKPKNIAEQPPSAKLSARKRREQQTMSFEDLSPAPEEFTDKYGQIPTAVATSKPMYVPQLKKGDDVSEITRITAETNLLFGKPAIIAPKKTSVEPAIMMSEKAPSIPSIMRSSSGSESDVTTSTTGFPSYMEKELEEMLTSMEPTAPPKIPAKTKTAEA